MPLTLVRRRAHHWRRVGRTFRPVIAYRSHAGATPSPPRASRRGSLHGAALTTGRAGVSRIRPASHRRGFIAAVALLLSRVFDALLSEWRWAGRRRRCLLVVLRDRTDADCARIAGIRAPVRTCRRYNLRVLHPRRATPFTEHCFTSPPRLLLAKPAPGRGRLRSLPRHDRWAPFGSGSSGHHFPRFLSPPHRARGGMPMHLTSSTQLTSFIRRCVDRMFHQCWRLTRPSERASRTGLRSRRPKKRQR